MHTLKTAIAEKLRERAERLIREDGISHWVEHDAIETVKAITAAYADEDPIDDEYPAPAPNLPERIAMDALVHAGASDEVLAYGPA